MSKEITLTARERLRIHLEEAKRATTSPVVKAQQMPRWTSGRTYRRRHCKSVLSVVKLGSQSESSNTDVTT